MNNRCDVTTLDAFIEGCRNESDVATINAKIAEFCKKYNIMLIQPTSPVSELELLKGHRYFLLAQEFAAGELADCRKKFFAADYESNKEEQDALTAAYDKVNDILDPGIAAKNIFCLLAKVFTKYLHEYDDISITDIDERLQLAKVEFLNAEKTFGTKVNFLIASAYAILASTIKEKHDSHVKFSLATPAINPIGYFFAEGTGFLQYQRQQLEETKNFWKKDAVFCLTEAKRLLSTNIDEDGQLNAMLQHVWKFLEVYSPQPKKVTDERVINPKEDVMQMLTEIDMQLEKIMNDEKPAIVPAISAKRM